MGRELLVIFSTATLLGLFFYIFHDFLNEKVAAIEPALRQSLSRGFLASVLVLLGPLTAGRVKNLWQSGAGWSAFASRCGEDPSVLKRFRWLQTIGLVFLSYGFFWLILAPRFASGLDSSLWPWQLLSLGLGAARLRWLGERDPTESRRLKPILSDRTQSRSLTLLLWRWYQLSRRHRLARLCLGLALGLIGLVILLMAQTWPLFILILLTMVISLLVAAAVAFQLEEDMRSIWFERQLGCSHEEFVAVYQRLCFGLGVGLGLLVLLPCLVFSQSYPLSESWKLAPIAALFPTLLPAVMFQLAPERPLLQILVTALVGLFLGTAIYAQGFALVLVPLLVYYAKHYQKDNFYRT